MFKIIVRMAMKLLASIFLRIWITFAVITTTNQIRSLDALKVNWLVRKTPIYGGDSVNELLALCLNGCDANCTMVDCDNDALASLRHAQHLLGGVVQAINETTVLPIILKWVPLAIVLTLGSYLFWKRHFVWGSLIDEDIMGGTGGIYYRVYMMMKFEVKETTSTPENPHQHYSTETSVKKKERMNILERANEEGFGLGLLIEAYNSKPETMISHSFNPMAWELEKLGEIRLQPLRLKKPETHVSDISTDSIESNNKNYYDTVFVDPDGSDSDEYNILETKIDGEDEGYPKKSFVTSIKQLREKGDRLKRYTMTQSGANARQFQHSLHRIKSNTPSSSDLSDY